MWKHWVVKVEAIFGQPGEDPGWSKGCGKLTFAQNGAGQSQALGGNISFCYNVEITMQLGSHV